MARRQSGIVKNKWRWKSLKKNMYRKSCETDTALSNLFADETVGYIQIYKIEDYPEYRKAINYEQKNI